MGRRSKKSSEIQLLEDILVGIFTVAGFLVMGIGAIVKSLVNENRKVSLLRSGKRDFSNIDSMSGTEFEEFVAELLRRDGYWNVRLTKATGDYGVDILATKHNRKWAFQCKCYHSNVGLKPIQEIYAGAAKHHADFAVAVTNRYFTQNATKLAKDLGVILWDRNMLEVLMGN